MDSNTIAKAVEERYTASVSAPPNPSYTNAVAQAFGYSASDLCTIPSESNLGLSCGNPLALANLHNGETVIDLGCGAGFDCFLAARKVGEGGTVLGVDMNETMLAKARLNATKAGVYNTTFLLSRITAINLNDATADIVISNCVINLVPHNEKRLVFGEMFRLLKPGGRLAVSDILTKRELSEEMKRDVALYVGCVAGASTKEEYEVWLEEAGFGEVMIVDAGVDLNVYTRTGDEGVAGEGCCGSRKTAASVIEGMKTEFRDVDLNQWAGSFKIFAVKGV
ncbi:putative ubiE/COQ5 methyltransferase [Karstenula rhodostoma CBS 690.94]|uniref:Arsenite methyltransferase n=1 Tax=Karstenula rhodostoma CBS 690.94 TaxID=1392251 RepID=A0A9P4U8G7_9PLEO|nr:putative ubiE/COQ5 methyltransferase [Karstenula rhodostoma CBS 690.94]